MRVMVQLREDAAMQLQQGQSGHHTESATGGSETEELLNVVAELGVRLEPLHPGQTHPLLMPHFMVDTPNRETAEKVIERLSRFKSVEAAYLKPDEELP
jgi:hypothetical protein